MTATRMVTIWCDGKVPPAGMDCGRHHIGDGTAAEARRELAEPGPGQWLVGLPGGRDLCPLHHDQRDAGTAWGDGSARGGQ